MGAARGRRERSLTSKLLLLLVVFIAVPIAVYYTFLQADLERRALLISNVQEQGRLVALGLEPLLRQTEPSPLLTLGESLARFGSRNTRIKVLFRPTGKADVASFFYVASAPPVPTAFLQQERDELVRQGILDSVSVTCTGNLPLANRYRDPEGREEVLTSITPVLTDAGCWTVIVSHPLESLLGATLAQPYWMRFEVRVAAGIYLALALLTLAVFVSIRRSVLRFRVLARDLRRGTAGDRSFVSQNEVSELTGVAEEFDRLVRTLRASAESIRTAAEDNAHAYKTPIAIMRQSLEPLKRLVPSNETRGRRALQVLETSLDRLDQLVSTARRMDETMAELLDPPRQPVELSRLIERMAMAYAGVCEGRGVRLTTSIDRDVVVRASDDLLETVLENVLDNAVSFSPEGGELSIALRRFGDQAEIAVEDDGPGVPEEDLEQIFERQYSKRPLSQDEVEADTANGEPLHAGIGLWVVRRNLEAIGGSVYAENDPDGGLILHLELPVAS